ncbi:hypothetical protein BH11PSE12_BH11PSE12_34960 [soil metagenome]
MKMKDCPHCHVNVMLRADGMCIACGADQADLRGVDINKTMVTIDHVHKMPACCFVCGVAAPHRQKLRWTYRLKPANLPWVAQPFVALLSYLPGSAYRATETIYLPTCADCAAAAKKARPVSLRTGLDCRLVVHRQFRAQFEALNGVQQIEWEGDIHVENAPRVLTIPGLGITIKL